jgi:hypothetical protein
MSAIEKSPRYQPTQPKETLPRHRRIRANAFSTARKPQHRKPVAEESETKCA